MASTLSHALRFGGPNIIPALVYTLSEEEARVGYATLVARHPRWSLISNLCLGTLWLALGLTRLWLTPPREHWWAALQIFFGAFYVGLAALSLFTSGKRLQRDFSLTFSDDGITSNERTPIRIPWRAVRFVQDAGDVIIITCAKRRTIVIPKRLFADAGVALWNALEGRLIGTYMLVRRPDSRLIANTADIA